MIKKYYIYKITDFGWSVIDPNDNVVTRLPMTEEAAQRLADDMNEALITLDVYFTL